MTPTRVRASRGQEQRRCPTCGQVCTFTLYTSWDKARFGLGRKKQARTYAQCESCGYRLMDADPTVIQLPD